MFDEARLAAALAVIREDPAIMQQVRDLAVSGAVSMEDAARAVAHLVVALADPCLPTYQERGKLEA